jgi:hypothetical protein
MSQAWQAANETVARHAFADHTDRKVDNSIRRKSSPLELQATVPNYQIPFVPIIQEGEQPFAMMVDPHKKYNWVLEPRSYDCIETLMKVLKPGIIDPAMKMHAELRLIKAKEQVIHPLRDFLAED